VRLQNYCIVLSDNRIKIATSGRKQATLQGMLIETGYLESNRQILQELGNGSGMDREAQKFGEV